jgi:hypothetical protein
MTQSGMGEMRGAIELRPHLSHCFATGPCPLPQAGEDVLKESKDAIHTSTAAHGNGGGAASCIWIAGSHCLMGRASTAQGKENGQARYQIHRPHVKTGRQ